ncbi:atp4 subunit B of the stator stalk of mitochondrial F1F0 ATP synthase [Pleurotus ostreatus]|uniref:ATP synthase subunit 4 n=3 Tax=Pleurotus TaxID=5320 RepID=A0A067NEH1_PLEO1|nr:atp4 subunit B of the stator stalk of mitochondrial F1F0 ATP synthase [Pleurotus ostreatus]KAF7431106.1 atp4 subunit B of the stator stalk of mitochondrial F1F0 ATP synthase [Pleurotus ostreatus]KAF9497809.1 ATP synthase [Pleurotus eryngii]KAJ8695510.1 atp4 subunit B of the stator stalk of mitochondrial F1F0 ATP synthase [Pleurotus ostreatus]KDQ26423.1 subunit B of the stator stalk of mitochondrial F1F0 ATP synthase [Pleurotus ostreatus PC15]
MAGRIALNSLKVAARPRLFAAPHVRSLATSSNPPPPAERASEIINKLPSSPNLITKTGTAVLGTGLVATAISQELYVLNEESLILAGSLILFTYIAKVIREPYKEWAETQIGRIRDILASARAEHTQTVKDRIDSVNQMKDVVSLTEGLFALSKETAQLESEVFVQKQKVALASEVKSVLDSWVRYEQQLKESEQADLTKTIIEKVLASLKDEKTQRDILLSSIAEVEQLVKSKAI